MTEIITIPVVTTQDKQTIIEEGKKLSSYLEELLTRGYRITHLASAEFNGALYNTYVLEKEI